MATRKITISAICELKQKLRDAPEYVANEVNMIRAIQLLAPHIRAMRAKGYTMDHVAQTFTSHGIPIAATTLKSYLSRFTLAPKVKPLRNGKRDGTNQRATALGTADGKLEPTRNVLAHPVGPTAAAAAGALRNDAGPAARPGPLTAAVSPTDPEKGPTSSPAEDQSPRYTSFIPRPDRRDI